MDAPTTNGNGAAVNGASTKLPLHPPPNGQEAHRPVLQQSDNTELSSFRGTSNGEKSADKRPAAQNGTKSHHLGREDEGYGRLSSLSASELSRLVSKKKGPPGGIDATPLPSVPQGYTVRFTFRSAANLPPSDINTASSDPYLTATLKTHGLKRHKDDPDLVHRTPTIQKTTEPEWNDEWIVANVPASGFTLKCRLYDEDPADSDDRLGNVTVKVPQVFDQWDGFPPPGHEFHAKKRPISKRAFVLKAISSMLQSEVHMTPRLTISMEVLGKSDPPYAQMCTIGPACWTKHYSPMIGRLAGTKVDAPNGSQGGSGNRDDNKTQKYE